MRHGKAGPHDHRFHPTLRNSTTPGLLLLFRGPGGNDGTTGSWRMPGSLRGRLDASGTADDRSGAFRPGRCEPDRPSGWNRRPRRGQPHTDRGAGSVLRRISCFAQAYQPQRRGRRHPPAAATTSRVAATFDRDRADANCGSPVATGRSVDRVPRHCPMLTCESRDRRRPTPASTSLTFQPELAPIAANSNDQGPSRAPIPMAGGRNLIGVWAKR